MRDIPPLESLVDALHDPIHPASGSLIRSQPVKGAGGVDETDIVWRLRANWSYLGREAADEITRLRNKVEQLQSEVADAKKWAMSERSQRMGLWRSEWISVRDRLPPVDEKVLYTCFMEGDGPIDYFTEVNAGYWDGKAKNLPGDPAMKYDDSNDWEPCSHWMPLPETPAL